jgi:hypothetical protein
MWVWVIRSSSVLHWSAFEDLDGSAPVARKRLRRSGGNVEADHNHGALSFDFLSVGVDEALNEFDAFFA